MGRIGDPRKKSHDARDPNFKAMLIALVSPSVGELVHLILEEVVVWPFVPAGSVPFPSCQCHECVPLLTVAVAALGINDVWWDLIRRSVSPA